MIIQLTQFRQSGVVFKFDKSTEKCYYETPGMYCTSVRETGSAFVVEEVFCCTAWGGRSFLLYSIVLKQLVTPHEKCQSSKQHCRYTNHYAFNIFRWKTSRAQLQPRSRVTMAAETTAQRSAILLASAPFTAPLKVSTIPLDIQTSDLHDVSI